VRPSWNGHLRLSLVSCPIGLVPATTEVERIKLNQLNPKTGNRISLKPVDSETGEPLERSEMVKGYKLEGDQYFILEAEELKNLQVESSRILDLETFIDRASVDPIYVDAPYYIYPEKVGLEAYRVIAEAMAADKKAAIGRIVLSTREHPVLVEPRGGGLMMFLLRTADEVRSAEYDFPEVKIDRKMGRDRRHNHGAPGWPFRARAIHRSLSGGAARADQGQGCRTRTGQGKGARDPRECRGSHGRASP
jgi:DNA end-binding protein Ku